MKKLFFSFIIAGLLLSACSKSWDQAQKMLQNRSVCALGELIAKNSSLLKQYDQQGNTLLHMAVRTGEPALVATLISAGANLNAQDKRGDTPLLLATQIGYYPIVMQLVKAGANLSIVDNHGFSAPKAALELGKSDLLDIFLAQGISRDSLYLPLIPTRGANIADQKPLFTPLEKGLYQDAQQNNLKDFKEKLTQADASGELHLGNMNADGNTLLGLLASLPSEFMQDLLQRDHTALDITNQAGETPLALAVSAGKVDNVRSLILAGASLHTVDNDGRGLLHLAVLGKDLPTFVMILRNVRALSDIDGQGNIPLHYAAQNTDVPEMLQSLLQSGSSVNAQNKNGDTPLTFAIKAGNQAGVVQLLKFGANPDMPNNAGRTPKDFARGTDLQSLVG